VEWGSARPFRSGLGRNEGYDNVRRGINTGGMDRTLEAGERPDSSPAARFWRGSPRETNLGRK